MNVQETQAAIAAAVTPVVMISANAILISGITAKHQSMSDRLRALTAEWRRPEEAEQRRAVVGREVRLLNERLRWVTRAHIVLYFATACFILMVIDIAVSAGLESWRSISLGLLIAGVTLMFLGIVCELLDLAQARRTIRIEITDVLSASENARRSQPDSRSPGDSSHSPFRPLP